MPQYVGKDTLHIVKTTTMNTTLVSYHTNTNNDVKRMVQSSMVQRQEGMPDALSMKWQTMLSILLHTSMLSYAV